MGLHEGLFKAWSWNDIFLALFQTAACVVARSFFVVYLVSGPNSDAISRALLVIIGVFHPPNHL